MKRSAPHPPDDNPNDEKRSRTAAPAAAAAPATQTCKFTLQMNAAITLPFVRYSHLVLASDRLGYRCEHPASDDHIFCERCRKGCQLIVGLYARLSRVSNGGVPEPASLVSAFKLLARGAPRLAISILFKFSVTRDVLGANFSVGGNGVQLRNPALWAEHVARYRNGSEKDRRLMQGCVLGAFSTAMNATYHDVRNYELVQLAPIITAMNCSIAHWQRRCRANVHVTLMDSALQPHSPKRRTLIYQTQES